MNEDDRLSVQNEKMYKLEFHSFVNTYFCKSGNAWMRSWETAAL